MNMRLKLFILIILLVSISGCLSTHEVEELGYDKEEGEFSMKLVESDGKFLDERFIIQAYDMRCDGDDVLVREETIDKPSDDIYEIDLNGNRVDYVRVSKYLDGRVDVQTVYGEDVRMCNENISK
jgi:hypothetical protein